MRVFEQAPEFGEIGAGIQLSPNCTRILHRLGMAEALQAVAFLPTAGQIRDWSSGETIFESALGEGVRRRYGYPYYHIHRADLVAALAYAAAADLRISLHTDAGVGEIEQTDIGVSLSAGGRAFRGAALVDAMDPEACFKWALFDRPPLPQWGKGRVTLLGDACHATLPFMAQGAAMAIEDGAVLAECLAAGSEVAASLKRYEGLRRARAARIQTGSRRNADVFHMRGEAAAERNRTVGASRSRTLDWLFRYDAFDLQAAEAIASAETPGLC